MAKWYSHWHPCATCRFQPVSSFGLCMLLPGVEYIILSLTGLTSYNHLTNIESLNICYNEVDSLHRKFSVPELGFWTSDSAPPELSCLSRLRELKADGNIITSTGGIRELRRLTSVSLRSNYIDEVDFSDHHWYVIE